MAKLKVAYKEDTTMMGEVTLGNITRDHKQTNSTADLRNIHSTYGVAANDSALSERKTITNVTQDHKQVRGAADLRNIHSTYGVASNYLRANSSIDEQFNADYKKQGLQPGYNQKNETARKSPKMVPIKKNPGRSSVRKKGKSNPTINTSTQRNRAKIKLAKRRVKIANIPIRSFGLFLWLSFQLPFAILSTSFLSISVFLSTIAENNKLSTDDALINYGLKAVGNFSLDSAGAAAKIAAALVGVDLNAVVSALSPYSFFTAFYLIIFIFGMSMLLGVYVTYKVHFLNPIFGQRGGGLKVSMFLLALIGYSLPILQFFPWFFLWTMAVRKNPL